MLTAAILVRDMPGFSADAQRTSAAAFAAKRGLSVSRVYADDGRCHRSARQALLHEAGSAVRVVLVASTAALGRTLSEVVTLTAALKARGVQVRAADDEEGAIEALVSAASLLADTQAALRREAIARGRERAKAQGVRFGRPPICPNRAERARAALAAGAGVRAAARAAGISPASVIRLRASSAG